MIYQTI